VSEELSTWGHEGAPGRRTPEDPRVQRTRAHVLEQARRLLAEEGPGGLHFSTLAARARVSRQTLYRYWPTPEALVTDLVTRRVAARDVTPAPDVASGVRQFLHALREVLADPAARAAYGVLMAAAARDGAAAGALAEVSESRRAWLNELLADTGVEVDADEFSSVAGPVVYAVFVAQREFSDALVEAVVADTASRHRHD
jgi:AcrR family transcriptional regulator